VRNLFTSSMPMIILFLPAVIALFHVYKVSLLGLLCILLSVVILTVSLTSFTLSFIIGIGYICKLFARKISSQNFSLKNYILTLLGIFIALIFFIYRLVARIDLVHIFKADVATDTIDVQTISTYFHFLPTHPFALEIILFENNDIYQGLFAFLILFFICIISLLLWYFVAPYFYTLWLTLSENISRGTGKEKNKQEKPLHFSGSKTTALFQKEFLILSRNMKGLIWFLFLFCIWLLELASNSILKRNVHKYGSDISSKADILQILHYSIAVYFICAFVLRFVFPAFSTDKKTAWILASSPVNMKKLFYSKYFFYSSFFLLLIPLFIVTTLFIVTSGLSFGALFPNKESDDPEQISTSMPGLFFTASALLFGALSDAILYLLLKENMIILFISFLFIVIIAIITMLLLVPKKLEQRGFYEQE
jgi:hypothetical protein